VQHKGKNARNYSKLLTISAYAPEVSIRQPNPKYTVWGAVCVVPARVEVLQRGYNSVTMVSQWHYNDVTTVLQWSYNGGGGGVTEVLPWCAKTRKAAIGVVVARVIV
jgi:hypothetical protein